MQGLGLTVHTAFSEHHSKQTLKEMGWGRQSQEDLCKCQDSLEQPRLYKKPCLKTKNKSQKKEENGLGPPSIENMLELKPQSLQEQERQGEK